MDDGYGSKLWTSLRELGERCVLENVCAGEEEKNLNLGFWPYLYFHDFHYLATEAPLRDLSF